MPEDKEDRRQTEQTPKGLTVPVPKRRDFFDDLKKASKPQVPSRPPVQSGMRGKGNSLIVEVREIDLTRRRRPGCGQTQAIERFGQLLGGEIDRLVRGGLWRDQVHVGEQARLNELRAWLVLIQ